MPSGMFNQWGPADKAKKLKIDGKWIWPDNKCNLDGIEPGMKVEFEMRYGGSDGQLPIVTKIWPSREQQANGHAKGPLTDAVIVSPLDDSGMRFVSNVVGTAIESGRIQSPTDIKSWALAAFSAIRSISRIDPEFDDDIDIPHEREPGEDDENPAAGMPSKANW